MENEFTVEELKVLYVLAGDYHDMHKNKFLYVNCGDAKLIQDLMAKIWRIQNEREESE
jgi:hypothetical protein